MIVPPQKTLNFQFSIEKMIYEKSLLRLPKCTTTQSVSKRFQNVNFVLLKLLRTQKYKISND